MNNAYTEGTDLILISEFGFVDGAQPNMDGYTQCGNVQWCVLENQQSPFYDMK